MKTLDSAKARVLERLHYPHGWVSDLADGHAPFIANSKTGASYNRMTFSVAAAPAQ
ncbi:hypothetical protein [Caballeronia udeis]|uniref:hypothetical protein n=1 Tax=Caballeronia udeis TaxID=1232866 RepID=UPI0012E87480|nr:hypothetical protein [Caballeronia udeis]